LLLPWVSFSLLDDLDIVPPAVLETLPTAIEILADLLDVLPLSVVAWLLDRMTSLPGYMLFVAMPHFHLSAALAVAAPAIAALFSLAAGLTAFLAAGRLAGRIAGGLQLLVSITGLTLLLAELPCLDQWGTTGDFRSGVLAVSVGAGLDIGAWVAAAALVLMAVGALITLVEPAHSPAATDYRYRSGSGCRTAPPWR